jgi:hypothetical protein
LQYKLINNINEILGIFNEENYEQLGGGRWDTGEVEDEIKMGNDD